MSRSVSPILAVVFAVLIVSGLAVVVQAPVKSVEVSTQRPEYFIGERVEAKIIATYTSSPDMEVLFEWIDPMGGWIFNQTMNMTDYPGDKYAAAFCNWTANMTGSNFTVRGTHVATSTPSEAKFNVSVYEDAAVVELLALTLSQPFYENNTVAKATTTLSYLGNGSKLDNVSFEWRYPNSTLAFSENLSSPDGGPNGTVEVNSSLAVVIVGVGYEVRATYRGVQPLSDAVTFDVIPKRVETWRNTSISGNTVWTKDSGPYGVCSNITIQQNSSLTIEAGSVIKFCPDSGMIVRGTLVMDAPPTSPIELTSYAYPSRPGDWKGVTFEEMSDDDGSIISHVVVEYSQRGLVFNAASPAVFNVTIAYSTIDGIKIFRSENFFSGVTVTNSGRGIYALDSTLNLADSEVLLCNDGIVLEDSSGTLELNWIHLNVNRGIWLTRSSPIIRNNVIEQNSNMGIRIEDSNGFLVEGNTIRSSNYTFDIFQSYDLTISRNNISSGAIAGISFWETDDVLVVNSTIASSGWSFRVAADSTVRALNCTFDDTLVQMTTGSRLYVENFLHVKVSDVGGPPLEGASVELEVNHVPMLIGFTGPDGWLRWNVVRYETFYGLSIDPEIAETRLNIGLEGYNITDNLREVDMSTSHTEQFEGYPLSPPDGNGVEPNDQMLTIIGIIGAIVAVILVVSFLLLITRRRRRSEELEEAAAALEFEIEEGKGYIVATAGSERSFEKVVSEIANGIEVLCFTRTYPKILKKQYDLEGAKVIWLSRDMEKGGLVPTNLGLLTSEADRFLRHDKKRRRIILLDGLEYLIAQNDFKRVLKLVNYLKDSVGVNRGVLLIPFNLRSVNERQAAMLTSDLEVV